MVLIILSWLYILFTTVNLGYAFTIALRIKIKELGTASFLGLFSTALLAGFWAVFGRISWEFHIFLLGLNLLLTVKFNVGIVGLYKEFFRQVKNLSLALKILLPIVSLLIVAQCASAPFLPDNESYYIQTIKWLDEYGFVRGIANLHFFFAQVSGWHILQSAFSFSFLYGHFNDLSGFCLLLGNVFAFFRLDDYFRKGRRIDLVVGLLPVANVFLFSFISSPSADLPIYVLTFIIFYIFMLQYKKMTAAGFTILCLFVLFAMLIKVTALPLLILPIVSYARHYRKLHNINEILIVSALTLALFLLKNSIVSGYAFYPLTSIGRLQVNFKVPMAIVNFYADFSKYEIFMLSEQQYREAGGWSLFLRWLHLPKLDGLFNMLAVVLVAFTPLLIYKYFNKQKFWILYFVMVLGMVFFYCTSPQYRFFLNFILFFSFLWATVLLSNRKVVLSMLWIATFVTAVLLFVPVGMGRFTSNKQLLSGSRFEVSYLVFPHSNSKSGTAFETVENGNLKYHSPIENSFFWGDGDGDLPCVNKVQVDYFQNYYHYRPQQRGNSLKAGFYSQPVLDDSLQILIRSRN
ncbi:hypothetical protein FNO01nite_18790 [Flavobacterium noncentrifugens]|uniref:DUF8201 domain-containing protein n=1 Tax=Flavobacterium noncentrifugens TaxID=1128970 RepID=A0A1G8YFD0_9FLAO|nr:hypothetical protein [Flavobacterium noncentrifugens]GEP51207.1 hypothetical protein FNO01nite_18790 [Flavobacterium noncentrifugens]SDK01649.1 hypothetical protein SAMN04487935_2314 [Flavobacterium noncentrifugens]